MEWVVRRAIIPPRLLRIASLDYTAMEYYFMLGTLVKKRVYPPLAKGVRDGKDVHRSSGRYRYEKSGLWLRGIRQDFKLPHLYGGGDQKLADQLGIPPRGSPCEPDEQSSTVLQKLASSLGRSHGCGTAWVHPKLVGSRFAISPIPDGHTGQQTT